MRNRRLAAAGMGIIAALTFPVAGCANGAADSGGDTGGNAVTTTTAPTDPAATLVRAADKLSTDSFKIVMNLGDGARLTGALDAPNKVGAVTMTLTVEDMTMTFQSRIIGTDLYSKVRMAGLAPPHGGKWMHLDAAKLPKNNPLGIAPGQFDPADAAKFMRAVTTAEQVDDRTIKGTLDLGEAAGAAGFDAEDITEPGENAEAVPFEATIDDEGRLSTMTIDMPPLAGRPAEKFNVRYSDFGTTVAATRPAPGKITEAPDKFYRTLTA